MNRLLYVIAAVLLISWVIGAFVFTIGKIIHILLVLGVIILVIGRIRSKKQV
jgi:hypothetical protein